MAIRWHAGLRASWLPNSKTGRCGVRSGPLEATYRAKGRLS